MVLLLGSSCGRSAATPTVVPAPLGSAVSATPHRGASPLAVPARSCDLAALSPLMRDVMTAIGARDTTAADDLLIAHLALHPTDLGAETALDALRAYVEELRVANMTRAADDDPTTLDASRHAEPRALGVARPVITIERDLGASGAYAELRADQIAADQMRRFHALPPHVPADTAHQRASHQSWADQDVFSRIDRGHTVLVVGRPSARSRVFLLPPRELAMARLTGDVLVVAATQGSNAVSAFDARSGGLRWQQDGLGISTVVGDWVISRAEKGVDVRDAGSGTVVASLQTGEPPRGFLVKGDRIFVFGTRRDLILRVTPSAPSAPPDLPPHDEPLFRDASASCVLGAAFDAVGARDLARLDAELAALTSTQRDGALTVHLRRAKERLTAWRDKGHADRIDLLAVAPTVLPAPPWTRTAPPAPPAGPRGKRVSLTQKRSIAYRTWEHATSPAVAPDATVSVAPVDQGKVPPGARTDVPPFLGVSSLSLLVPRGDDALLLYGERWLAIVRGQRAEKLLDLDAYRQPPIVKPKDAFPGAPTYVSFATVKGDVLYLCNGGGSYAEMARGKTGYVTALDARDARVLWQSDPVVCRSEIIFWRDYIVTGYGFTAEPDFVYVLRASDGKIVGKAAVDSAPAALSLAGDRLTVNTYEREIDLDLSEH